MTVFYWDSIYNYDILCVINFVMLNSLITGAAKSRGLTLSEILYTLAEITEIKLEIVKSTSQKKSRTCAEIRNQSIVGKFP